MSQSLEIPGYHFPDEAGFEKILSRLKEVSGAENNRALSLSLGLQRSAVGVAKTRRQIPASWIVEAVIRFGTSASWLLLGQNADQVNEAYCVLPIHRMALNDNGELEPNHSADSFVFVRSWIESKAPSADMRLLQMNGTAMEPLIHDKDLILVNTNDLDTSSESDLFLVTFNESVYIRRLAMEPGKLIIRAENRKLVPDVSIDINDKEVIRIMGKVIWWSHERP